MKSQTSTSREQLKAIVQHESEKFQEYYTWMESAMPPLFFEELDQANIMLIIHNLMELDLQDYTSNIQLKNSAIIICLDQPDTDLQLLKHYSAHAIISYQTYVSKNPPPFTKKVERNLRIVVIQFFTVSQDVLETPYSEAAIKQLREYMAKRYPDITDKDFYSAINGISPHFLRSMTLDRLGLAIKMFHRATTRDHCQYEVQYNDDYEIGKPSMQIVLAWRNTPKHNFLYRLVRTVHRHGLSVKWLSASYLNPYNANSILVVAMDLHGVNGKPVWEVANMPDFIKDFITVKYFSSFDNIDFYLVQKGVISGNIGNLLRAMANFIHQALVHLDVNLYTLDHIEEGLCRHPELTVQLCQAFKYRFSPDEHNEKKYSETRTNLLFDIDKLDTGNEDNDIRRKNILNQGMNFIHHTLKTNFYRPNYTALSFRLDPKYLDYIPFDRTKKFPEQPYAIIFIKGMHFFGFHIRFKDLARGGLRTVIPEQYERMILERNNVFTECYNLAWTQHLKNKDIPEGGAKGIIFLKPYERMESEASIFRRELQNSKMDPEIVDEKVEAFKQEQKVEHLYQAQRSFIESLVTVVNCDADGKIRARDIIDYWNKPEYIYLGPDENMHDSMIQWIASYSKKHKYKPGSSFISGKPDVGINHKEYGVTSLGLNVYAEEALRYLGIDPAKDIFTVKLSGGPDGDVAGNEIRILYEKYPNTAKIVALTDISGTIFDPKGLDLSELYGLFKQGKSIRFYPPQKLNDGGFLVDKMTRRYQTPLVQQVVCWRKHGTKLDQDWLSGSEMNHLLRTNIHQTPADLFIPGGGRPRTLNEHNYKDFLDSNGKPTAKAIVEGANLYLDHKARRALENLGVLVIKDSSANKTGVICSSFEVLCGLTLGDEKFVANKDVLVKEILARLHQCAANEASLLLRTHTETGEYLTDLSDKISRRINLFKDQILSFLDGITLSDKAKDPLIKCFLSYCPPTLREKYRKELISEIPDPHKKAVIACHIASHLVYEKGLSWFPSVVDILPVIIEQQSDYKD